MAASQCCPGQPAVARAAARAATRQLGVGGGCAGQLLRLLPPLPPLLLPPADPEGTALPAGETCGHGGRGALKR